MAKIICPGCNQEATIGIESIKVADTQQIETDENYSNLSNIAQQTGIPLTVLVTEAREIAGSLEGALPILESKYNICSVCGKKKEVTHSERI